MKTIVVTAQVNSDGLLNVTVPIGRDAAYKTVRVTVAPVESTLPLTREAWLEFLQRTGGSITDPTFERHPQSEYEERDWES